jgi:hypothetical protein
MNKESGKQRQNEVAAKSMKTDGNQLNTTPMDDMQMEDFEHVDDPFFSNKSMKKGTNQKDI